MTATSAIKSRIRTQTLARRDAIDARQRTAFSARACKHLETVLQAGQTVSLFWPIRSEIDPHQLIEGICGAGGTVLLPAIVEGRLVFRRYAGPGRAKVAPLEPGPFGTCHPGDSAPIEDPQLIVAPLSAFDRSGNRIGYGAGHYDRAIAALIARKLEFRLVGMAFACQEVDKVPVERHDQRLAAIATEAELIMPKNNAQTTADSAE